MQLYSEYRLQWCNDIMDSSHLGMLLKKTLAVFTFCFRINLICSSKLTVVLFEERKFVTILSKLINFYHDLLFKRF